ncbi:hypothetical protein C0993_008953 [Termitomyces sp. T159_Od127]|nr:hypothetical protein C0993_008953 [Termitomyces sp. T159_Od127]
MPDVPEDIDLCSLDRQALHGLDAKQLWPEEHNVAVVVPASTMVCSLEQHIGFSHTPARLVVQQEVKVGQVQRPLGLLTVELLGCPEVLEVLVISPNLKLMLGTLQEVPPFFKELDDGQHLLVVDLVVALYCVQAFGVEGHWMPLPIILGLLQQDSPGGKVRAVCFHLEGRVIV